MVENILFTLHRVRFDADDWIVYMHTFEREVVVSSRSSRRFSRSVRYLALSHRAFIWDRINSFASGAGRRHTIWFPKGASHPATVRETRRGQIWMFARRDGQHKQRTFKKQNVRKGVTALRENLRSCDCTIAQSSPGDQLIWTLLFPRASDNYDNSHQRNVTRIVINFREHGRGKI